MPVIRLRLLLAALLLSTAPAAALADGGLRATPENWPAAWNWDPLTILNLLLLSVGYAVGLTRLRLRSGSPRIGAPQAAAFATGLLIVFTALLSPLDALGEELSAAHMVQHMLLISAAAPLCVLGAPAFVLSWSVPPELRRWWQALPLNARWTWHAGLVWLLHAAVIWLWHLPPLYHAALRDPLVHDFQHLSFFAAGFLFWRLMLDPVSRRVLSPLSAVMFLFSTSVHAMALGVFMTFSRSPWYADYAGRTIAWGFSPLEDQQLAGLIMWVPACLVYPAAAAVVMGRYLSKEPPPRVRSDLPRRESPSAPNVRIGEPQWTP